MIFITIIVLVFTEGDGPFVVWRYVGGRLMTPPVPYWLHCFSICLSPSSVRVQLRQSYRSTCPTVTCLFTETLRMHPPIAQLERVCTQDYTLPDSDLSLKKGTTVQIPVIGLHYDPDYYPDPYKFDPNRFSAEEKCKRSHYVYLPFGTGPRNCIGTCVKKTIDITWLGKVFGILNFENIFNTFSVFIYSFNFFFNIMNHNFYLI